MKWLIDFPFEIEINKKAIDMAVRSFSVKHDAFFSAITSALNALISSIHSILQIIPWWLFVAAIFFAGWKSTGKIKNGIIFSIAILIIGFVGLWALMLETLSIIIAAVLISLFFGLPLGILIAQFDRAEKIARPILDTMQTMPVFVYLIPALLFFGLGKAPAVIATTIYAIVPVIRLTCLGIRQVDKEVVEAARAFGSTTMQTLIKVQIPQAKATIMTGVNQTLMMAMAMVVTCSMIGASGLGMEVLMGVQRIEIGRGLIAGIAVVILAIVLDRITQGIADKGEANGK